jgi:hypothetical protein
MSTQPSTNGNGSARIEVVGGQPVIFVGDRMFALPAVNATNPTTAMGDGAAMDHISKQTHDAPTLNTHVSRSGLAFGPSRASSTSPSAGLDLTTLKTQQTLKRQELRTVEQTEVLQASHQSEAWRAGMIEKKRCLIVELDALRKSIAALENDSTTMQGNSFFGPIGTVPATNSLPTFMPQLQQPAPHPVYGFSAANPYASLMMYQPPYGSFQSFPGAESAPFVPAPTAAPIVPPHSPGSASRRSYAIAIKPPQEETKKQCSSALNPKSPTYEPPTLLQSSRGGALPTPSPPKQSPWRSEEEARLGELGHRVPSQKPSLSSIDTTDFFPTDTHEHSSTRLAPRAIEPRQPSNEHVTVPRKHWPASPWNEANSGRSRPDEPSTKLTSWPEAFGKQRSSSSLRQSGAAQPYAAMLDRAPVIGSYGSKSASSNNELMRTNSNQRTSTDENWPFSRKMVTHVPSTYQEGYQAGYDHIGMPDSHDVLQGYIQGLLHFLTDESKKGRVEAAARDMSVQGIDSRIPSLRGLVAGSMPHDSAVSMTFTRNNGPAERQENIHTSKDSLNTSLRRDSAYSPQGSVKDIPVSYALFNESAHASRQRHVSSMQHLNSASVFSERLASARQVAFSAGENEAGRTVHEKGIASRADMSFANSGFARHFSGAQIQNQGYGTSRGMQRFYPTPKEMNANDFDGDNTTAVRSFADNRMSGLDGAMDDLAELVPDANIDDHRTPAGGRAAKTSTPVEAEEVTASCFRPSSSKGKQKATSSPIKYFATDRDTILSSPNLPSPPKKPGEQSPAKVKLEQVTNKFRRVKKDDPRTMSPEDKKKRSDTWRRRFQHIKKTELEEIEEHRRNSRN